VASDPNIILNWEITPSVNSPSQYLEYSYDRSLLLLKKGALDFSTTYTLKVTVSNSLADKAKGVKTVTMEIGKPPELGWAVITPQTGTFLQTQFSIELKGWQSNNPPIVYRVWGIDKSGA